MEFIPPWLVPVSAALAAALSIWNFIQSPSKKNESDIGSLRGELNTLRKDAALELKTLDDKADAIANRVNALEIVIHQMPDKDSMHRLELNLEKVTGQINTLSERLTPINNLSQRLQEFLLEKAK